MLLSATLSKPTSLVDEKFGRPITKIKLTAKASAQGYSYYMEEFTAKQVFHQHLTEEEALAFIDEHAGKTFKNCVKRTENQEITILANKKGKITTLVKDNAIKMKADSAGRGAVLGISKTGQDGLSRKKKYLIEEGTPVPFLVLLGVMTDEGKIISSRYDKFRQINRFLELIDDILPEVQEEIKKEGDHPVRIADFGCGKSYLTFAVHYFLTEIKKIPCEIEGLDLKKDVIEYCNQVTEKLGLSGLFFRTGDISEYSGKCNPDIVITLHACDTATDYALKYAVSHEAKAILSVPCCQHQVNSQLTGSESRKRAEKAEEFEPLLKWGIIREKFSSLVTDALRGEWLEGQGYRVQMLEFIDMEHTPKNILIRAIKRSRSQSKNKGKPVLAESLGIQPEIFK
ncbi:MAG: SAM-dependent methyltransferase [Treponema sp.]|nr:SAM-dependent methyltransferase [Treponema sp.]